MSWTGYHYRFIPHTDCKIFNGEVSSFNRKHSASIEKFKSKGFGFTSEQTLRNVHGKEQLLQVMLLYSGKEEW